MCGIASIYAPLSQKLSDEQSHVLEVMKAFMVDRGPDGNGQQIHQNVGMVHTRLSIVDVDERSNQPMESEHWILTFNGEIVNYKALKDQLKSFVDFKTESDTEVLLLALEHWGIDKTLQHCAGMFAFCAYNKATGWFYAARDQMGIKPLFVYEEDSAYWFASTPATIKSAYPEKAWREDKETVASFFILGAPFTGRSTTLGITQVPPAHYCAISPQGNSTLHKYWTPAFQANFTMDDLIGIIHEYKHSDVKSALFMSGGIDSTFLASIIRDMDYFHLNSPELAYAKQVAKKFKQRLVVVNPKPDIFSKGVKKACHTFGEPLMSVGIPSSVAGEVANRGYKMAISANGADELFFGYPRTPLGVVTNELHADDRYQKSMFGEQISHIFRNKNHFLIEEYSPYFSSLTQIGYDLASRVYLKDFSQGANYRWLELMTYVLYDLNPALDAASMAHSLEVRVPFLDHRIVQGVLSWPTDVLYKKDLGRKAPLKRHIMTLFGKKFVDRPKLGFSIDKKLMFKVDQAIEKAYLQLKNNQFILPQRGYETDKHYERNMLYLKSSCYAFEIWHSQLNKKFYEPAS